LGRPENEETMTKIVHVVGTGTIGEPLIGLLADDKEAFGIDEVTFHKRTPLLTERSKVNDLVRRGAVLATDDDRRDAFEELGHAPKFGHREAIERATVVIDCTPVGNDMKAEFYEHAAGPRGFIAQGSEFGFGKMYARGINDEALDRTDDRFLHVVSCNTHNISVLIKTLAMDSDGTSHLEDGQFLCIRRSNDISQDTGFAPSPTVETHKDRRFGTHHARDAHGVFATLGYDLNVFSSALKLNTQYMHAIHFRLALDEPITVDEAVDRFVENKRIAITYKRSANQVFSFGRDHGYFGRILSQTVVPVETLAVRGNELIGFCFTPQDGNPLLSTVAATLWYLDPDSVSQRMDVLRPYLFQEV
jgi:glyceraldehyde-3-phosphate dehydrogenase (NAD(P))